MNQTSPERDYGMFRTIADDPNAEGPDMNSKIDSSNRKLDEAELDDVHGAGTGGHWDHSGKASMWVTTVPGDAHGFFKPTKNRSSVRPDGNGGYIRWDRAGNCEAPAIRRT